jgi:hypothetical protein
MQPPRRRTSAAVAPRSATFLRRDAAESLDRYVFPYAVMVRLPWFVAHFVQHGRNLGGSGAARLNEAAAILVRTG